MPEDMTYSIEIGRWTGIFSPIYYADVFVNGRVEGYYTFNAFTKAGALRKARRYIDRISTHTPAREIYSYDILTHTLQRIS